jgi:hypothetical protein
MINCRKKKTELKNSMKENLVLCGHSFMFVSQRNKLNFTKEKNTQAKKEKTQKDLQKINTSAQIFSLQWHNNVRANLSLGSAWTAQKTPCYLAMDEQFLYCCTSINCRGEIFTMLLPHSNILV